MFALVAMVLIPFAISICFDGPDASVMVVGNLWTNHPDAPVNYTVYSFGYELMTRTVPNHRQFETEAMWWEVTPAATLLAVCAVLGWYFGRWFS